MDKKYSVQEVAKLMMETETENENSDASDLGSSVTAPVSRALHQCCLTAVTVMKIMVVAVDGWKKWSRNEPHAAVLCCYIYVTIMLVIIREKIVLYLVSNCVKGDMELDVDSPQQQQLLQSDYDVEVAMEGGGEKKILYKKNS